MWLVSLKFNIVFLDKQPEIYGIGIVVRSVCILHTHFLFTWYVPSTLKCGSHLSSAIVPNPAHRPTCLGQTTRRVCSVRALTTNSSWREKRESLVPEVSSWATIISTYQYIMIFLHNTVSILWWQNGWYQAMSPSMWPACDQHMTSMWLSVKITVRKAA